MDKIIRKYNKKIFKKKIIFADLETIIDDNKHLVVCIVLIKEKESEAKRFDSLNEFMFYLLTDCKSSIIYFHNFGRFDSTFILNWITEKNKDGSDIEIIERNNIIYEIKYKTADIYFRDSYLIINKPLKEIGEKFCVVNKKPEFEYGDITEIFKTNPEKVHNQCISDCLVLKEGFLVFRDIFKQKFDIEVCNYLTLPSLAFNLFKKEYYKPETKPISKNPYETDEFIRRSYKGGVSEVFIPVLKDGFCYDVNSLYPFCMYTYPFPIGRGKFVEGCNINLDSFIGFIECRVSCDKEINFLTYKHKTRGLISPIGEWTDVYFHEEVKLAIKLGYKITFLKGFKYKKESRIFENYVEDLYQLRVSSKNNVIKDIAKLLLNSLYGRFGMKVFVESTKFIKENQLTEIKKKYKINNINYIGNNFYSISGIKRSISQKELYKNSIDTETAIQIASAITAYARIFMYKFKNLENNECYYTDTDSIFVKKKLDNKIVNDKLGCFKLEYEIDEAIFISPKVYYVKKKDGEEKVTLKGLKKEEYTINKIKLVFRKIITERSYSFTTDRISLFKRDLIKMVTYIQKYRIKLMFPLTKRIKIFDKNVWVNTRAIKIKN